MSSIWEEVKTGLNVELEVFQGPFELLYHLITANEIDIFDIPIAKITDQYLAYLVTMQELNLDVAGEFIVMAATLLQIKARMLLPSPKQGPDEGEEEDPRRQLVEQLMEYRRFKEVAQQLARREQEWSRIYFRSAVSPKYPVRYDNPVGGFTVLDLWTALQKTLEAKEDLEPKQHTLRRHLEVSERILWLSERIIAAGRVRFRELIGPRASVEEVVVTFLALLELMRRNVVSAVQSGVFADIEIEGVAHESKGSKSDSGGRDFLLA